MAKRNRNKRKKPGQTLAEQADKHVLYEKAVQCSESEIDFIDETFHKLKGRKANILREDFCGTTNSSCEWIRRRPSNVAYSVDIDPDVLKWGKNNHISSLTSAQAKRIKLVNADVVTSGVSGVDVVLAMNFSYWVFKDRNTMKTYFKSVHNSLADDGVFFLDSFGGYEAFKEMQESTKLDGFNYIWEQSYYNPITGEGLFHIHFKFRDGSKINNAFTYDWRIWTLPELTEMLNESGFKATVYWEGTNEEGEGNGEYSPSTEGDADAGWVAYIVAEK